MDVAQNSTNTLATKVGLRKMEEGLALRAISNIGAEREVRERKKRKREREKIPLRQWIQLWPCNHTHNTTKKQLLLLLVLLLEQH